MLADIAVSASCGGDGTCGKCRMVVETGAVDTSRAAQAHRRADRARLRAGMPDDRHRRRHRPHPARVATGQAPRAVRSSRQPVNAVLSPEERVARLPRHASPPPVAKRLVRMIAPGRSPTTSTTRAESSTRSSARTASATRPSRCRRCASCRTPPATASGWSPRSPPSRATRCPIVSGFQAGRHDVAAVRGGRRHRHHHRRDRAHRPEHRRRGRAGGSEYNAQTRWATTSSAASSRHPSPAVWTIWRAGRSARYASSWTRALDSRRASRQTTSCRYYVAGNTVMTHLFLGITPEFIRTSPYVPATSSFPWMRAAELGLPGGRATRLYAMPCPASWLGGDIVAGVVAAGVPWTEKLTLFIDVGTNGEIVLGNSEWLVSCVVLGGPGVRGRRHPHGMRAADGAIEQVRIDDDTLEPTHPDHRRRQAARHLRQRADRLRLRAVLVRRARAATGKFRTDLDIPAPRARASAASSTCSCDAEESGTGRHIVLTEVDIENLMRAKAAIYSGITVLAESLDLSLDAIEEVVIAGGFGHYLDLERVTALGMVPEIAARALRLPRQRIAAGREARRDVARGAAHGPQGRRDDHLPRALGERRLHGPLHVGALPPAHGLRAVPRYREAARRSAWPRGRWCRAWPSRSHLRARAAPARPRSPR